MAPILLCALDGNGHGLDIRASIHIVEITVISVQVAADMNVMRIPVSVGKGVRIRSSQCADD